MQKSTKIFITVALSTAMLFPIARCGTLLFTDTWNSIRVTNKEALMRQDGSTVYRIWTDSGEVLEVRDQPLRGVWNSSDLYGQLDVDHHYDVRVNWFREHILSQYRGILEVKRREN